MVLPSLLEGFGLPAVEAMACGTPVISSRAGSLPEVVGEAGVYFDPTDVGSIAGAIRSFLNDPCLRPALARLARQRSALFTWEASAQALLACFDELEVERGMNRRSPRVPEPHDRLLPVWSRDFGGNGAVERCWEATREITSENMTTQRGDS